MSQTFISPTLHTAAIASLEHVINQALALDTATLRKLEMLNGHVFQFECVSPALSLYLIPSIGEIRLCGIFGSKADTQLTGSLADFIKLASSDNPSNVLINESLELNGDSHALIALQKIIAQLDIDWEAPLADLFGDVIGHQLGNGLRGSFNFARRTIKNIKRQANDYIVEESNWFPANWELNKFNSAVDQINVRTDRLEAKLRKASKLVNI
jgi:ubiquinone biosynthesis protein UbiJ